MEPTIAGLSSVQAQVAYSLASGASITSTAQSLGIGRSTIHYWIQTQPDFARFVDDAKEMYVTTLRDQLRDASAKALATIISILDDPSAPASVRLKASLAILNRPQFPDRGWILPEKIEANQVTETQLNKSRQNFENSQPAFATAPTGAGGTVLNDSGQKNEEPNTPIRSSKVGRNEPCPCGSGVKFKRCCINKTPQQSART